IYMPLVYTRMSAPTPSLRGKPGLYPAQAAGLVARAVVRRSRVIAPWLLWPTELFALLFRLPVEWMMVVDFRRTTDSPSARGERSPPGVGETDAPRETPSLRRAFRTAGLLPLGPVNLIRMARAVLVQGGRPS